MGGQLQRLRLYFFEHLLTVLGGEGRHASEHLVHDAAEGPPVHRLAVALLEQDLGRQVLRRAAFVLRVHME